jgi:hypothetical protein
MECDMPWFPDFASAVELARRQTRAAGLADPVGKYFTALNQGDTHALETVWPGEVVIYDPRAGEVRGHRKVRQFISHNLSWLAGLHARTERVADTCAGGRAVVEQQATLAIRAHVPLAVLRDTIQPFPTFSEIYAATLKALHKQIAGAGRDPVS